MQSSIASAKSIQHERLESVQLIKWVLPTVVLAPFCEDAGLALDDITYRNKPNLRPEECERLTSLLWPSFSASIGNGRRIGADEARTQLVAKSQAYVRDEYEHVVFKHCENVFVAEYDVDGSVAQVLRCWKVPSANIHPTTVFVTFDGVAEKQAFDRLAAEFGYSSDDLILELARDFAEKFKRRGKAVSD